MPPKYFPSSQKWMMISCIGNYTTSVASSDEQMRMCMVFTLRFTKLLKTSKKGRSKYNLGPSQTGMQWNTLCGACSRKFTKRNNALFIWSNVLTCWKTNSIRCNRIGTSIDLILPQLDLNSSKDFPLPHKTLLQIHS